MGPSWYWMPDIFENFFADFGKSASDYYKLEQLSPAFQMIFSGQDPLVVPAGIEELLALFESIERGGAERLKKFMEEGEMKYKVAMQQLIYKPAYSWREYATVDVIKGALSSHLFRSMSSYVRSFFKDERLIALMEFPVIFLGAMPEKIPALYSLMNYAAFQLGTWYPQGGMYEVVKGMQALATSLGAEIKTGHQVDKIVVMDKKAIGVHAAAHLYPTDAIIASADYHHVEQQLLEPQYRNYGNAYWSKRVMAPSCLIFYIGVNKQLKQLLHHNLFFDAHFHKHVDQIYTNPQWPDDPLFYVCCPSKTDSSVAPAGMENLFVLVPIAAGLEDTDLLREHCFSKVMARLEKFCGEKISDHLVVKRSYCVNDFVGDYNAFKGNAYGLANTLGQTAVWKPKMKNKKINNLFYAGQLTVPGPGVPPAIISGKIAAAEAAKYLCRFWT